MDSRHEGYQLNVSVDSRHEGYQFNTHRWTYATKATNSMSLWIHATKATNWIHNNNNILPLSFISFHNKDHSPHILIFIYTICFAINTHSSQHFITTNIFLPKGHNNHNHVYHNHSHHGSHTICCLAKTHCTIYKSFAHIHTIKVNQNDTFSNSRLKLFNTWQPNQFYKEVHLNSFLWLWTATKTDLRFERYGRNRFQKFSPF